MKFCMPHWGALRAELIESLSAMERRALAAEKERDEARSERDTVWAQWRADAEHKVAAEREVKHWKTEWSIDRHAWEDAERRVEKLMATLREIANVTGLAPVQATTGDMLQIVVALARATLSEGTK